MFSLEANGYGIEVDWWALGVLIFDLLACRAPFPGDSPLEVASGARVAIERGFTFPEAVATDAKDLLTGLFRLDPKTRLGMQDVAGKSGTCNVRKHAFFQSIDFAKLLKTELDAPFVPMVAGVTDLTNFDAGLQEPDLTNERASWKEKLRVEPHYGTIFDAWNLPHRLRGPTQPPPPPPCHTRQPPPQPPRYHNNHIRSRAARTQLTIVTPLLHAYAVRYSLHHLLQLQLQTASIAL
jgi:serine/threonine protein kinase